MSFNYSNFFITNVQPIADIGRSLAQLNSEGRRRDPGGFQILFHTDAAQAIGKIPVMTSELNIDYLTLAGHKA